MSITHYNEALNIVDSWSDDTKGLALMILGAFCFASMGAVIHALGSRIDWHLLVVFRTVFTFLFATSLLTRSGALVPVLTTPTLLVRSLAGSAGMLASFYALTHLPISDATVVIESRPVWVALLAALVLGERTGGRIWIYMVAGLVGVALIEQPYFAKRDFTVLIALGAAFAGGVAMVCLRKLASMDGRVIVAHFSATATVVILIKMAVSGVQIDIPRLTQTLNEPSTLALLAGMGVFGTLGQLAMTKAFSLTQAPRVASIGITKVGIAASYDMLFWGRTFTLPTLAGMALILGSLGLFLRRRG